MARALITITARARSGVVSGIRLGLGAGVCGLLRRGAVVCGLGCLLGLRLGGFRLVAFRLLLSHCFLRSLVALRLRLGLGVFLRRVIAIAVRMLAETFGAATQLRRLRPAVRVFAVAVFLFPRKCILHAATDAGGQVGQDLRVLVNGVHHP